MHSRSIPHPHPRRREAPLQRLDVRLIDPSPLFRVLPPHRPCIFVPNPSSSNGVVIVVAIMMKLPPELVLEFPALLEGRVFFLVHVHQLLLLDEELCASGDALLRGGVDEGFGERGEAFWVVHDERWAVAEGVEVRGSEAVEEAWEGGVRRRWEVVGFEDGDEVGCRCGGGEIRERLPERFREWG